MTMAPKRTVGGVVRRSTPSVRYNPYDSWTCIAVKEDMKHKVIILGVELSLCVAESMFLLCDDLRTMLCFCFHLWRRRVVYRNPVSDRLLRVIHTVYPNYIKPKNDGISLHWELISSTWEDFAAAIIILYRIVFVLRRKDCCDDYRLLSPAIARHKQVLKKLQDKLRSAKDVSEANGFLRETLEPNFFYLWNTLFDEESGEQVIRTLGDLFQPILCDSRLSQILALPVCPSYSLGKSFEKEELEEDVVQLGVELSLLVAQSMFFLCDDIRTVLWFCFHLWGSVRWHLNPPDNQVVVRLVRVMHCVYLKDIKPKNGVYQTGGKLVHRDLMRPILGHLALGFTGLDPLVLKLRAQGSCGQDPMPSIEENLKMAEDKLECVKGVSEANGFAREAMEIYILDLWKSLVDKEAKEATWTLKAINETILYDLFLPIRNELVPPP